MKKLLAISLLTAFSFCNAQVLEKYPQGQTDYIGGNEQFYKDFNQVVKDKNLKPCENKNEVLDFKIVVYPDRSIKYVKPEDPLAIENNKCAFDLTREVAKYLKGWNPATLNGEKIAAVTSFLIIPSELFDELKPGYNPVSDMKPATYEGGINNFRKKVVQNIDISRFKFNGDVKLQVTFIIDAAGQITNLELAESSGLKAFDEMIIKDIATIKNKWTPANVHGIPISYAYRLPLKFSSR